jgi:hypothetical protein
MNNALANDVHDSDESESAGQLAGPTAVCRTLIKGPSAWVAGDHADPTTWTYRWTHEELAEFDAALAVARADYPSVQEFVLDPNGVQKCLPRLERVRATLSSITEELEHGRGFSLLRGLPVGPDDKYSKEEAACLLWMIGRSMGDVPPHNGAGHLVGSVKVDGTPAKDPSVRHYGTTGTTTMHNDFSDIVGLLCLRQAAVGGESLVVSSDMVHNLMLEEHPDLLPELYFNHYIDRKSEQLEGMDPWYRSPVYIYVDGKLSTKQGSHLRSAQRLQQVPRLTQRQIAALDAVEEIRNRDDMTLYMRLEPGDLQLLNSYTTLHNRLPFEHSPDTRFQRHLLRVWVTLPDGRRLTKEFEERRSGIPFVRSPNYQPVGL